MYEQDDVEPCAAISTVMRTIDDGRWVNVNGHEVKRGLAELKRRATESGDAAKGTITITINVSVGPDGSADTLGKLKFTMPAAPSGAGMFVVDEGGDFTSGPSTEGKRGYTNAQDSARKGARA